MIPQSDLACVELHRRGEPSRWAIIDKADLPLVSQYRWHAAVDGNTVYALAHVREQGRKTTRSMHVVIMGKPGVDHVDGDGLNNTRANLRFATKRQNGQNRRSNAASSSKYKGVSWYSPLHKWRAALKVDGKDQHLGYFADELEAAKAYDAAALSCFGEYANLNAGRTA